MYIYLYFFFVSLNFILSRRLCSSASTMTLLNRGIVALVLATYAVAAEKRQSTVDKRQAPTEGDYADRSSDGSYAFRYGDRNQFHSVAANKDNVVSGRYVYKWSPTRLGYNNIIIHRNLRTRKMCFQWVISIYLWVSASPLADFIVVLKTDHRNTEWQWRTYRRGVISRQILP